MLEELTSGELAFPLYGLQLLKLDIFVQGT